MQSLEASLFPSALQGVLLMSAGTPGTFITFYHHSLCLSVWAFKAPRRSWRRSVDDVGLGSRKGVRLGVGCVGSARSPKSLAITQDSLMVCLQFMLSSFSKVKKMDSAPDSTSAGRPSPTLESKHRVHFSTSPWAWGIQWNSCY